MEDLRKAVLEAATVAPCHITGMHDPNHTTRYLCEFQKEAVMERLLQAAGLTWQDLHKALHGPTCYWCHNVPSQEQFREKTRDLHRWAGVEISAELAAPAADAT